jgi:hypothetical protein
LKYCKSTLKRLLVVLGGVIAWHIFFTVMAAYCVFDYRAFIDRLWLNQVKGDIYENLAGVKSLRTVSQCGNVDYHYSVRFTGPDNDQYYRSFDEMVDVASWTDGDYESASMRYSDDRYDYSMMYVSDGPYVIAHPRAEAGSPQ